MVAKFLTELPRGFHTPIMKVVIMEIVKERVQVGDSSIYDMELLPCLLIHKTEILNGLSSTLFDEEREETRQFYFISWQSSAKIFLT